MSSLQKLLTLCLLVGILFTMAIVFSPDTVNEPNPRSDEGVATTENQNEVVAPLASSSVSNNSAYQQQESRDGCLDLIRPVKGSGAERADLWQQCRMAVATEEMAYWSMPQFWASAMGAALLVIALLLTLESNGLAREAVKVARDIGQAEIRAYPRIDRFEVHISNKWNCLQYDISCINHGKTAFNAGRLYLRGEFQGDIFGAASALFYVVQSDDTKSISYGDLTVEVSDDFYASQSKIRNAVVFSAVIIGTDIFKQPVSCSAKITAMIPEITNISAPGDIPFDSRGEITTLTDAECKTLISEVNHWTEHKSSPRRFGKPSVIDPPTVYTVALPGPRKPPKP